MPLFRFHQQSALKLTLRHVERVNLTKSAPLHISFERGGFRWWGLSNFVHKSILELFPKPQTQQIPRLTVASLLLVLMMSSFPACACHRLSRSPMPGADVGILSIASQVPQPTCSWTHFQEQVSRRTWLEHCLYQRCLCQDCLQNETEHAMTSDPEGNGPESVINKRSPSSTEGSDAGNKSSYQLDW